MTLHLIKLCVGCDSVKDLEDWIREKRRRSRGKKTEHVHRTRIEEAWIAGQQRAATRLEGLLR